MTNAKEDLLEIKAWLTRKATTNLFGMDIWKVANVEMESLNSEVMMPKLNETKTSTVVPITLSKKQ